MRKTLREIAELIEGKVIGDETVLITGVAGIREAQEGEITFLANQKYLPLAERTRASAIITSHEAPSCSKPTIRTVNPSLAFAKVVSLLGRNNAVHPRGIHPTALIGDNVALGKEVALGAYAVIRDNVSIGDGTVIYPASYVGSESTLGSGCVIYPHVTIRERIVIGNNVIIHSGTVIGSDGFGFVTIKGTHHKIPQVGIVEIGDDVEIGANVTIDRARFEKTVISRGTKIDNLVQIAHNVIVGQDSLIVAQAGISGSTTIGKNVTIAGQAGLVGHITVGDEAIIAAQAGVTKSVPSKMLVSGYPAREHDKARRINARVQNLPRLYEEVARLKKRIEELENKR